MGRLKVAHLVHLCPDMKFYSATLAVFGLLAVSEAYDLRQLYSFSGGDGKAFCKTWKCEWYGSLLLLANNA